MSGGVEVLTAGYRADTGPDAVPRADQMGGLGDVLLLRAGRSVSGRGDGVPDGELGGGEGHHRGSDEEGQDRGGVSEV